MPQIPSVPGGLVPNIRGAFGGRVQSPGTADQSTLTPQGFGSPVTTPLKIAPTPQAAITPANNSIVIEVTNSPGFATRIQIYGSTAEPAILGLIANNLSDYADFTYDGNNGDIDVSHGGINLRPLDGSAVKTWSPSNNNLFSVGSSNFTQALSFQHDGTNAHITSSAGFIGVTSGDKFQFLSTGAVNYSGPTSTTATIGSNGAPPAQVQGYLTWQVGGTTVHIPYYL